MARMMVTRSLSSSILTTQAMISSLCICRSLRNCCTSVLNVHFVSMKSVHLHLCTLSLLGVLLDNHHPLVGNCHTPLDLDNSQVQEMLGKHIIHHTFILIPLSSFIHISGAHGLIIKVCPLVLGFHCILKIDPEYGPVFSVRIKLLDRIVYG